MCCAPVGSVAARKGKLVATGPTGTLPNNIIAKAPDSDLLDGLNSTQYLRSTATAGGDLTGTYPHPRIGPGAVTSDKLADGAVGLSAMAPEVGLGFFTGRVTGVGRQPFDYGAPSGLSQVMSDSRLVRMPSPDRPIRLSEFTASLTTPTVSSTVTVELIAEDAKLDPIAELDCVLPPQQTGCTTEGPSSVVPPGSFLSVHMLPAEFFPANTDLLFSWRAQSVS